MFNNYLTVAIRNLLRHKTYSAINIAGLAVGIACCLLISMRIYRDLSFDSFHQKADRIYRMYVKASFPGQPQRIVADCFEPCGPEAKERYPVVDNFVRFFPDITTPAEGKFAASNTEQQYIIDEVYYCDPSIFNVFSFELAMGNADSALEEPYCVVLTQKLARKIFGEKNPLGKVLSRKGGANYKVTGVLKDIPANSHIQFNILISISTVSEKATRWADPQSKTYLLLGGSANSEALEKNLSEIIRSDTFPYAKYCTLHLQPLREVHLKSADFQFDWNWKKSNLMHVYIFSIIAALILVIACINFVNLSTARAGTRAREVGLRKVVGASRGQLIRQFLGESLLVVICAMVLALTLLELSLPTLSKAFNNSFDFGFTIYDNWILPLCMAGIVILTGFLAGSYPALLLSAFKPATILKGNYRGHGGWGVNLRKALVVGQFSVTIVLIVCTIVISGQLHYMLEKKPGFDIEQVITVKLKNSVLKRVGETLKHDWLQNPAITGVTASRRKMGENLGLVKIHYEGDDQDHLITAAFKAVDYDYLPFYGLELVEGRNFSHKTGTDFKHDLSGGYIINETLKKEIGWDSALGRQFGINENNLGSIIGVVKDFHFYSFHQQIGPLLLYVYPDQFSYFSVKVKPDGLSATLKHMEKKWGIHVPELPFEYSFLDKQLSGLYDSEALIARLLWAFSTIAVLVSCLGLLGLISFSAEQRTKEIGIRKVLGASVLQIVLMLSKDYCKLLIIATLIAWPVAWYFLDTWLQDFAYRIEVGPGLFVLGAVLALIIALLTVSFQAIKAASANPVEALRYE
jgi:putative ABC transport system permease protein